MLGGTGQLNFNIHSYGVPSDYNLWETEYGAQNWSYQHIKKYIKRAECLEKRPKLFHVSDVIIYCL